MNLSRAAISEFKTAYLEVYKISLADKEANEKGLELLEFMQLIYKEVPKKDQELLNSLNS